MRALSNAAARRIALGVLAHVLLCVACFGFAVPQAYAYGRIDVGKQVSLEVSIADEGTAVAGMDFALYRVANVSDTAELSLAEEFAGYGVALDGLDSEGWRAAAQTLAGYAARDQLEPLASAVTDSAGAARFDGMAVGLYLLVGQTVTQNGTRYDPEPALVLLPQLGEDGAWVYGVTAAVKFGTQALTRVDVLKTWVGDTEETRPSEIQVHLLENGHVVDTQTLNAENGWRCTWADLDPAGTWQVVEAAVPDGYAGSVSREGDDFVITNTAEEVVPETPGAPGEKLPQTGTTWWLVAPLALVGVGVFAVGWHRRRASNGPSEQ